MTKRQTALAAAILCRVHLPGLHGAGGMGATALHRHDAPSSARHRAAVFRSGGPAGAPDELGPAQQAGAGRQPLSHRAGRHCSGAREQHRHRGGTLQSLDCGLERYARGSRRRVARRSQQCLASRSGGQRAGRYRQPGGHRRLDPGTGSNRGATTNATIQQIGPVTQTLDPVIQEASTLSHTSTPQPDPEQSETPNLVADTRAASLSYQQGLLTGGSVTLTYTDYYSNENAPTDILNPSSAPSHFHFVVSRTSCRVSAWR